MLKGEQCVQKCSSTRQLKDTVDKPRWHEMAVFELPYLRQTAED